MRIFVAILGLSTLACSSLAGDESEEDQRETDTDPAPGGSADDAGIPPSDACAQYIDCLTATAPEAVGPMLESYGEGGTCWENEANAEACDAACAEALADYHAAFPDEEACDDGTVPPITVEGGDWLFEAADTDCRGDGDLAATRYEAELQTDGDDAFTLDGRITLQDQEYTYEVDVGFDCVMEGDDAFSCADEPVHLVTENDFTFSFAGTFSGGGSTAEAEMRVVAEFYDIDCTSTMDGEEQ
jgi:hypothetical protein